MRRALATDDPDAVRDAAHRIKGGLLNVCSDAAAAAALAIEEAGARDDLSPAAAALGTLTTEHERLLDRLRDFVARATEADRAKGAAS